MMETKTIKLYYLGAAKERDNYREPLAYGHDGARWSVAVPLSVLQSYFGVLGHTEKPQTLYNVLGLSEQATAEEIKKAYRRLARQWHPDVCKERNAETMFKRINEANQILSDDLKRRKYNAGLAFEKSLNGTKQKANLPQETWRPPLRCGWLLVNGQLDPGNGKTGKFSTARFFVSEILAWEDITENGLTMVSTWAQNLPEPYYKVEWR